MNILNIKNINSVTAKDFIGSDKIDSQILEATLDELKSIDESIKHIVNQGYLTHFYEGNNQIESFPVMFLKGMLRKMPVNHESLVNNFSLSSVNTVVRSEFVNSSTNIPTLECKTVFTFIVKDQFVQFDVSRAELLESINNDKLLKNVDTAMLAYEMDKQMPRKNENKVKVKI